VRDHGSPWVYGEVAPEASSRRAGRTKGATRIIVKMAALVLLYCMIACCQATFHFKLDANHSVAYGCLVSR